MLYNGGFTAGIVALILIPILEHYVREARQHMNQHIDLRDMMTLDERPMRESGESAKRGKPEKS